MIAQDPFIGGNSYFKLSGHLTSQLHSQGIFYLADVNTKDEGYNSLSGLDLNLSGPEAEEWSSYVTGLKQNAVTLSKRPDSLVWLWDKKDGQVTVREAYEAMICQNSSIESKWWYSVLWKSKVSLKHICFSWLCLMNRVLTSDNYQIKGGIGPSVCPLCLHDEETIQHLFMECITTQDIWIRVCSSFKIDCSWVGLPLEENLKFWFFSKPKLRSYPFMVIWGIWLFRNIILFKIFRPSNVEITKRIIKGLDDYKTKDVSEHLQVLVNPVFFGNAPIGFFDGVTTDVQSGIGMVIKVSNSLCYKAHMAIGVGSNIRAELLAFWGLLSLCIKLNLLDTYIAGDSKVVIDWYNNKSGLNVLDLQQWKDRVRVLGSSFHSLQVFHVHRQFNALVDLRSKEGLHSCLGILYVDEYNEAEKINCWSFSIF